MQSSRRGKVRRRNSRRSFSFCRERADRYADFIFRDYTSPPVAIVSISSLSSSNCVPAAVLFPPYVSSARYDPPFVRKRALFRPTLHRNRFIHRSAVTLSNLSQFPCFVSHLFSREATSRDKFRNGYRVCLDFPPRGAPYTYAGSLVPRSCDSCSSRTEINFEKNSTRTVSFSASPTVNAYRRGGDNTIPDALEKLERVSLGERSIVRIRVARTSSSRGSEQKWAGEGRTERSGNYKNRINWAMIYVIGLPFVYQPVDRKVCN